jgi:hypothetical protein
MKWMAYPFLLATIVTACSGSPISTIEEKEAVPTSVVGVGEEVQLNPEVLWEEALKYVPNEISLNFSQYLAIRDSFPVLDVGSTKSKLAVGLVLLKQYDYHLTCCNQSYNLLDQRNPNDSLIVAWFVQFASCSEGNKMFIPSFCAYEWMKAQPEAQTDEHVRVLLRQIEGSISKLPR